VARMRYDEEAAAAYRRARELTPAALEEWCAAVGRYIPPEDGLPLLDLGAGTGVFAEAFARRFGLGVLAVEPSAAMRGQARRRGLPDRVRLLGGEAERIPLADASCGAAWLSLMIHHVGDLAACAAELRRVLAPGSPVLVRQAFPGRAGGITLFRFFPTAARVHDTYPDLDAVVRLFTTAGFTRESFQRVRQTSAPDLRTCLETVRLRIDTTLRSIPDEEFHAGLAALTRAAASTDGPVVDELDLLVLRAAG
jgi:ubiquinone/menaquinone biosynthesis C-methylase UbiE